MRKIVLVALAAGLLLVVSPARSDEAPPAPPGTKWQEVAGSFALPTRFIDGESGFPGLGRRVYNASAAANGTVMYVFDVDPETWGGAFVIDGVKDATGEADLDVFFYEEFGDASGQAAPVSTAQYAVRGKGGETGFVAPGTRKAIVFSRNGVRSTFNYTGYKAPVISIANGPRDLSVPAGATVRWRNDTTDYSFVRHTSAGTPVFNSSTKPGTGIRVGDTFSYRFEAPGTYPYETSAGPGTITVAAGPGVGTPTN